MTTQTGPAGYCLSCGRGDVAPTAEEYEQQRQRAERAEGAIERVREALDSLQRTLAHDPRDWGQDKRDAWIWGIVCGWGCEEQHDHDVICGRDSALRQVAARHGWADEVIERLVKYRRAIAALEPPAPAATEATELETTARVLSALHQTADDTVTRVITLHEQWVAAGPPPLGVPLARWWDRRLAELHNAIQPADQTTEK